MTVRQLLQLLAAEDMDAKVLNDEEALYIEDDPNTFRRIWEFVPEDDAVTADEQARRAAIAAEVVRRGREILAPFRTSDTEASV